MSDRTSAAEGARRAFGRLAAAAVALTLAVVVASAFLRHAQAGLSCDPWPACYARASSAADAPTSDGVRAARIVHRLSATAVTAAILGLMLIAWSQRPVWRREGLVATGALAIAGALAVLGVVTPGSKLPAVVLGNLLGGYVLLALVATAWALASPSVAVPTRARWMAVSALAAALVVAALGGSIGAHYASRACPGLLACGATWDALATGALHLLQAPATLDDHVSSPPWGGALHVAHRVSALVFVALTVVTAVVLKSERPRLALALLVAVCAVLALGTAAASSQPRLAIVVLHNASAAVLVTLLVRSAFAGVDAPAMRHGRWAIADPRL